MIGPRRHWCPTPLRELGDPIRTEGQRPGHPSVGADEDRRGGAHHAVAGSQLTFGLPGDVP